MLGVSRIIDMINTFIGKFFAYAILLSILFSAYNAVLRKFPIGSDFAIYGVKLFQASNLFIDLQWQLFGLAFMMAAPWTLFLNEHIRIDVVSKKMSQTARCWIDIIGHAFVLIPFSVYMSYTSLHKALRSLEISEQSFNTGGLPQWPAKFIIPIAFGLLAIQGISELIKRIYVLRGKIPDPHQESSGHNIAHEMEPKA